jgi:quinol monooxygenase YgiN
MPKIACITTLIAVPGKRDELATLAKLHAAKIVETEPGTLRIDILVPLDDPDKVVVWDIYESVDAIEIHRNGQPLRDFVNATKGLLLNMSGIRHTLIE